MVCAPEEAPKEAPKEAPSPPTEAGLSPRFEPRTLFIIIIACDCAMVCAKIGAWFAVAFARVPARFVKFQTDIWTVNGARAARAGAVG